MSTITKPPYSKDGKLQLCSRCGKYCRRTLNMCPTCNPQVTRRKCVTPRNEIIERITADCNLSLRFCEYKHLVGVAGKRHERGYFLVNNDTLTLDRATYREIAAEARQERIEGPFFVYCRICTYSGPGLEVIQIDD